ncbi:MAG: carbohydrate ABC transporter permease [Clostridia bacterium]|nr:carbohydrate ABC transporter permease [Clostridia bacterium]MBR6300199.1 carbohydrate ABC transporter permease [Clostridia bacterium]
MRYQGNKINPSRFSRGQIPFFAVLLPMAVIYMLPIVFIFVTAFKPLSELFAFPPRFYVIRPTLNNFRDLAAALSSSTVPLARYVFNSIVSTVITVVASVLISLYAGYSLAKKKFRSKALISTINTMAMMFVPVAVTIPRYLVMKNLLVLNTFFALVLPLIAMPVGLFLITQFISDVPDALIEAARIDGATEHQIVRRVIAPIVRPALATVAILAFQASWNAVEPSTTFVDDELLRTFPFYLSNLASSQGSSVSAAGMVSAASLITFIPNLVIFIFMQSKVLNTMAHSGIK